MSATGSHPLRASAGSGTIESIAAMNRCTIVAASNRTGTAEVSSDTMVLVDGTAGYIDINPPPETRVEKIP